MQNIERLTQKILRLEEEEKTLNPKGYSIEINIHFKNGSTVNALMCNCYFDSDKITFSCYEKNNLSDIPLEKIRDIAPLESVCYVPKEFCKPID